MYIHKYRLTTPASSEDVTEGGELLGALPPKSQIATLHATRTGLRRR